MANPRPKNHNLKDESEFRGDAITADLEAMETRYTPKSPTRNADNPNSDAADDAEAGTLNQTFGDAKASSKAAEKGSEQAPTQGRSDEGEDPQADPGSEKEAGEAEETEGEETPDELQQLKEQNEALRKIVEQLSGQSLGASAPAAETGPINNQTAQQTAAETEGQHRFAQQGNVPPQATADVSYMQMAPITISDDEWSEAMNSADGLNKLFQKTIGRARQQMMMDMGKIVNNAITTRDKANNFFIKNQDLAPFRDYVIKTGMEIERDNPGKNLDQILDLAANTVRERLHLVRQRQDASSAASNKPTKGNFAQPTPKRGPNAAPKGAQKGQSTIADEIDQMEKLNVGF